MHRTAIIALAFCLAPALASAAQVDPLANARAGKLQCYTPDRARKTCAALAGYTFGSGDTQNQAEVLLSPTPPVVMKTVSPVTVRDGAVCGPLRKQDLEAAVILISGRVADDKQTAAVRSQIETAFGPRLGKEVCTTYIPSGDEFLAQVTIDGVSQPEPADRVIWVGANDGYAVAP